MAKPSPPPSVLAALKHAIEAAPDDRELRLHYAELLLGTDDPGAALEHSQEVLNHDPANAVALRVAADACFAIGDEERGESYVRLTRALAGEQPVEVPTPAKRRKPKKDDSDPSVVRLHAVRASGDVEGSVTEIERPGVTLEDVGGMEQVKRRLRTAFLVPLENPVLRRMYGKSLRGGLLLYGPPGCGKTFIARATAGELGARFIGVGLHDILGMWLGESEKNLHELFENARRNAPCVLFFDEVDAVGRKRSQLSHSAGREVVVQFLAELDSFGTENEGVFVLAATNHPWDVDSALRRPGRLDRTLLVLPPDQPARAAILRYHLRDRPLGEIDVEALASVTGLFSGADLAHVCESAAELALEDSVQTGVARPIQMTDLENAVATISPSTIPWLQTARNYAMFSGEGGVYDELVAYLRSIKMA